MLFGAEGFISARGCSSFQLRIPTSRIHTHTYVCMFTHTSDVYIPGREANAAASIHGFRSVGITLRTTELVIPPSGLALKASSYVRRYMIRTTTINQPIHSFIHCPPSQNRNTAPGAGATYSPSPEHTAGWLVGLKSRLRLLPFNDHKT